MRRLILILLLLLVVGLVAWLGFTDTQPVQTRIEQPVSREALGLR